MLFVTHIPKTAGTSLRLFLWTYVDKDKRFAVGDDIPGDMRYLVLNPTGIAHLKVIFGHFCYGWHRDLVIPRDAEVNYVTVLRDPIDRIRSLYDYATKHPGHYLYPKTHNMTLWQFVTSGVTSTTDNAMVRQLCGEDRFGRGALNDMKIPFGELTRHHLEAAKKNLETYALVGITERYQRAQDALADMMEWPRRQQFIANPTGPNRLSRIHPRTKPKLREFLSMDYELYELAKEMAP
jgi:hypothetical protein